MTDEKKPDAEESATDYEVGYGKPPQHTRFQPGRSGNSRGRPKGTKNLKTDLMEELSEKILVREGEQSRRVSKQRAMVKTLMAHTLKGDMRSATLLLLSLIALGLVACGLPHAEPAGDGVAGCRAVLERQNSEPSLIQGGFPRAASCKRS